MARVIVIDYGVVNIKNVIRGFECVGANVESSKDPDCVYHADRVVLPGVGAFAAGMTELEANFWKQPNKCQKVFRKPYKNN